MTNFEQIIAQMDEEIQARANAQLTAQSQDLIMRQMEVPLNETDYSDWDTLDIPERIDTPEENARLDAMRIETYRGML
jgi:hypothetical protein